MTSQLSPFELERRGYKLKSHFGETEFAEYDTDGRPTGSVLQYYTRGDNDIYALVLQEPKQA